MTTPDMPPGSVPPPAPQPVNFDEPTRFAQPNAHSPYYWGQPPVQAQPPQPPQPPQQPRPLWQTQPAPPPSRRKWMFAGAGAVTAALVAVLAVTLSSSGGGSTVGTRTTTALAPVVDPGTALTFELTVYDGGSYSDSCDFSGTGYSDVDPGTPVTVKDASGTIVAADALSAGIESGDNCVFTVYFDDPVKLTSNFYSVEAGRRGSVTFTKAELTESGGKLAISLGE